MWARERRDRQPRRLDPEAGRVMDDGRRPTGAARRGEHLRGLLHD